MQQAPPPHPTGDGGLVMLHTPHPPSSPLQHPAGPPGCPPPGQSHSSHTFHSHSLSSAASGGRNGKSLTSATEGGTPKAPEAVGATASTASTAGVPSSVFPVSASQQSFGLLSSRQRMSISERGGSKGSPDRDPPASPPSISPPGLLSVAVGVADAQRIDRKDGTPAASGLAESDSQLVLSRSVWRSVDDLGNEMINDYTLWQEIGRGTAGVVYLVIHNATGELRALKAIPRKRVERVTANDEQLLVEVAIMKKIRHPHVVALYECIDDPTADFVYLVMQYIPDGPIAKIGKDGTCTPLKGSDVDRYMRQLVHALAHIHVQGVVHGDIKPDNILIDKSPAGANDDGSAQEPSAYLADFGVSHGLFRTVDHRGVAVEEHVDSAGLGTPLFFAPEVFAGAAPTQASDVWALGVTFFVLIYGRLPFEATSLADLARQVETDTVVFTPTDCGETDPALHLDAGICAVLSRMLIRDPALRVTAAELVAIDNAVYRNLPHAPALPTTPLALTDTEIQRAIAPMRPVARKNLVAGQGRPLMLDDTFLQSLNDAVLRRQQQELDAAEAALRKSGRHNPGPSMFAAVVPTPGGTEEQSSSATRATLRIDESPLQPPPPRYLGSDAAATPATPSPIGTPHLVVSLGIAPLGTPAAPLTTPTSKQRPLRIDDDGELHGLDDTPVPLSLPPTLRLDGGTEPSVNTTAGSEAGSLPAVTEQQDHSHGGEHHGPGGDRKLSGLGALPSFQSVRSDATARPGPAIPEVDVLLSLNNGAMSDGTAPYVSVTTRPVLQREPSALLMAHVPDPSEPSSVDCTDGSDQPTAGDGADRSRSQSARSLAGMLRLPPALTAVTQRRRYPSSFVAYADAQHPEALRAERSFTGAALCPVPPRHPVLQLPRTASGRPCTSAPRPKARTLPTLSPFRVDGSPPAPADVPPVARDSPGTASELGVSSSGASMPPLREETRSPGPLVAPPTPGSEAMCSVLPALPSPSPPPRRVLSRALLPSNPWAVHTLTPRPERHHGPLDSVPQPRPDGSHPRPSTSGVSAALAAAARVCDRGKAYRPLCEL